MYQVLLPTHESYILPTILMLAGALERNGVRLIRSPLHRRPARVAARLLGTFNVRRLPWIRSKEPVFCQLNHAWRNAFYPFVLRHPLVTYTFDCWPYVYDKWQKVFALNRPRIAFIAERKSVAEMSRCVPGVEFRWLPEAGDPTEFDGSVPLCGRDIDVFEIGRSYRAYHDGIRGPLALSGYRHVFPQGDISAPLPYQEAVTCYRNAKIVVCFPKSVTDPERAGGVETTTFRYFESIFSKCLMIGHCPAEFVEILGYNPVIEADMDRPAAQLVNDILPHLDMYQPFVECNYETLCRKWTVEHQARAIVAALQEVAKQPAASGWTETA